MMKNDLKKYLQGEDFKSIADVDHLIPLINTQNKFDKLYPYLFTDNRLIVMRAADAIEKITKKKYPFYLHSYNAKIIELLSTVREKVLKWPVALMASRMDHSENELKQDFELIVLKLKEEKIPSLNARIKKLKEDLC